MSERLSVEQIGYGWFLRKLSDFRESTTDPYAMGLTRCCEDVTDALAERVIAAEAEVERLREALYQALTAVSEDPADYGVVLDHQTGLAALADEGGE